MNTKRPHKVTFRLSDVELNQLRVLVDKSGYNTQQFITKALFSRKLIEKDSMSALLVELRKQGVNLNQIARSCNAGNQYSEVNRINSAITNLENLWQYLRRSM